MKKIFSFLTAILFAGSLWATDPVTVSVSISDSSSVWSNGVQYSTINLDENVTATGLTNGNNSKYYSSNNSWRHYEGDEGTITIETTSGELSSVTFTYANGNSGVIKKGSTNVTTGTSCSISGTSVTFSVGHSSGSKNGNVQITNISVTYTPAGGSSSVKTPTFDPNGGSFVGSVEVQLLQEDSKEIYYTTNGDDPTTDGTLYENPFTLTATTTVKAAAKDGDVWSSVVTKIFTRATPTLTLTPATKSVAATNVAQQSITLTATNFVGAISSVTTGLYSDAECNTSITSGAWVKDITANEEKTAVTFNVDDNDGLQRKCWLKITVSDGSESADAILPITQAKYEAPATLPFAFNSGKSAIETTNGLTQSGLGTDYSSSPKLKFDHTGDYLILWFNEAPGELTFDIKGNGFSGGTFKVQTSIDGETYTDLETYTSLSDTQSESFSEINSSVRFIKWIYTSKSDGNVALGKIALAKSTASGVDNVETSDKAIKVLREGQIFILRGEKVYTVQGQLVK